MDLFFKDENEFDACKFTHLPSLSRVEVIDENGRSYVNWHSQNRIEYSFQDGGRTLKIFITRHPE